MTAAKHLIPSDEAFWQGHERAWAHITQFPPKKTRSSWWLVFVGVALVAIALGWM
jgi:hypothetical protein